MLTVQQKKREGEKGIKKEGLGKSYVVAGGGGLSSGQRRAMESGGIILLFCSRERERTLGERGNIRGVILTVKHLKI